MVFPTPCCCCPSVCSADGYWNYLSPRMESYSGVLAKAIDVGTNHLVKGIVVCSKAYASQGANVISPQAVSGASKTLGRHRWS
uniref:Senescence domain-containing protein n=1 Tax=Aegilops tauschii subsp. strangulata TaxID=200361 RepID=A0A453QS65_AEGTS